MKIVLLLLTLTLLGGQTPLLKIDRHDFKKKIQMNGYIYHRGTDQVMVLGVPEILKVLREQKIPFKIAFESESGYQKYQKSVISNEGFVKYHEVVARIEAMVQRYPDLFEIKHLGNSVAGRSIVALKTKGDQYRPKYRIAGAIHGNEAMAYQFVYDLIGYFDQALQGEIDSETQLLIQELIEHTEIWFIPMVNPDGAIEVSRYNNNHVDLNRNFGFFWKGQSNSGPNLFSEPETQAMKWNTLTERFALSYSFHTYGDYINYVWNFAPDPATDHSEVVALSELYQESTTAYTVIEGYDWYQTFGDLNDYSYGTSGDIDWTIEVDDDDPDGSLYEQNRDAVLSILQTYKQGVIGQVINSNGEGLEAVFKRSTGDTLFYSDPDGHFYRYLQQGGHTYQIYVPGYQIIEQRIILKGSGRITINPVVTDQEQTLYPLQVIEVFQKVDPQEGVKTELPQRLLLPPDQRYFKLNRGARVVIRLPERSGDYTLNFILKDSATADQITLYRHDGDSRGVEITSVEGEYLIGDQIQYIEVVGVDTTSTTDIPELDTIALHPTKDPCDPNPCEEEDRTICQMDQSGGYICLCDEGFHLEEEQCLSNQRTILCGNTLPEFARWGDENPGGELLQNWSITEQRYLPDGSSCLWYCLDGYTLEDGRCISGYIDPCTVDNICTEADRTICSDHDRDGIAECNCDEGYHLNEDQCEPDRRTLPCENSLPENGVWLSLNRDGVINQVWDDITEQYLPDATQCSWGCSSGYEKRGESCFKLYYNPCYPENPCGEIKNSVCEDGDRDGIAICNCIETYHKDGGECLPDYRLKICGNVLPEGALWNGPYTIKDRKAYQIQWWDGEQYLPDVTECNWICSEGYYLDGDRCKPIKSVTGCHFGGGGTYQLLSSLLMLLGIGVFRFRRRG